MVCNYVSKAEAIGKIASTIVNVMHASRCCRAEKLYDSLCKRATYYIYTYIRMCVYMYTGTILHNDEIYHDGF